MANGYTQSPKLLKGALIQFSAPLLIPVPNIIIFQYNPETMTRTITPWTQPENGGGGGDCAKETATAVNPLAQPIDPCERFNLTLELDAADGLEDPDNNRLTVLAGVADRLAMIEMLLYPPGDSGIGNLVSGIRSGLSGAAPVAERTTVPVVLFYWGPGRIVPVRIESFSVDEQAYSPTLYPIRATVTLGMKILDAASFGDDNSATLKLARAAYLYTRAQKETLALARIAEESILGGLLPF